MGWNLLNLAQYREATPMVHESKSEDGFAGIDGVISVKPETTYTFQVKTGKHMKLGVKHGASDEERLNETVFTMWFYMSNETTNPSKIYRKYDTPICLTSGNFSYRYENETHVWTYKTKKSETQLALRVNTYSNDSILKTATFWDFKLEEGTEATSWTPSYNDIARGGYQV